MSDKILLIQTGGTIDAVAYENPENPPLIIKILNDKNSLIMPTISNLRLTSKIEKLNLSQQQQNYLTKDSKEFSKDNVASLAEIIKQQPYSHIIITHGTDAMINNAKLLAQLLIENYKIIVFLGAMIPLSMNNQYVSDGIENLEFAINNITKQNAGIYVIGRIAINQDLGFFKPELVTKDREASIKTAKLIFNL